MEANIKSLNCPNLPKCLALTVYMNGGRKRGRWAAPVRPRRHSAGLELNWTGAGTLLAAYLLTH